MSLPVDVRSASTARTLLREALTRQAVRTDAGPWSEAADSGVLMVSELVTNAVRHTLGLLLLEITVSGVMLHIGVVDDAPEHPQPAKYDLTATSGRGLKIVQLLADRWGVVQHDGSKTVWFELALH